MSVGGRMRSKSSKAWLQEHWNDPYVLRAKADGYRGRAAYKLLEIQDSDRLIRPGDCVVDLGCAPGAWSQIASRVIGDQGRLVGSDILAMDSIAGMSFIQGDFTEESTLRAILKELRGHHADVVISDMAPNASGNRSSDQIRAMYLCELALDFCQQALKLDGALFIKVFHGEGFDAFFKQLKTDFSVVKTRKPEASRARSRETYLLATGFRGR